MEVGFELTLIISIADNNKVAMLFELLNLVRSEIVEVELLLNEILVWSVDSWEIDVEGDRSVFLVSLPESVL
jgi:hypothetical protein